MEKNETHFVTDPDVQSKSYWSHRATREFQSSLDLIAFNLNWKTCLWERTSKQQCSYGKTSSEYIMFSRLILEIRCLSNTVHTWFPLFDWLLKLIWIISSCYPSRGRLFLISSRNFKLWFPFYFVGQMSNERSCPVRRSKVGHSWYSFYLLVTRLQLCFDWWKGYKSQVLGWISLSTFKVWHWSQIEGSCNLEYYCSWQIIMVFCFGMR